MNRWTLAAAMCLLAAAPASAHHSYTEFDDTKTVEIEGVLTKAAWQNPHARLTVEAKDASGAVATWDIETTPVNALRRNQVPLDAYQVGSVVKVAGWPSKRTQSRMYGTNLLSADGQETVLWHSQPRWKPTAFGTATPRAAVAGAARATSIFHVWGSGYARPGLADDPDSSPAALFRTPLKLTPAAQAAMAAFDPVTQTTTPGCTPKGMPAIMAAPAPMELVDRGDTIVLRQEEYDTVRTFYMKVTPGTAAAQTSTPLGYSVGRWEGDTLVVETGGVSEKYLTTRGTPLGPKAQFVERFSLAPNGERLLYTLVITDPDVLVEPVEQKRSWLARPDQVQAFNCVEDAGR